MNLQTTGVLGKMRIAPYYLSEDTVFNKLASDNGLVTIEGKKSIENQFIRKWQNNSTITF